MSTLHCKQSIYQNCKYQIWRHFAKRPTSDYNTTKPEVFMKKTGSPYAYIAGCAVKELGIKPSNLFKGSSVPRRFRVSQFQYVHPKELKYELPKNRKPEIAFIGRSNVGKSSLINALGAQMNSRKGKALVSKTPGRTQQVNFFSIQSSNTYDKVKNSRKKSTSNSNVYGYFVDLPGYGHARAPERVVKEWTKVTQEFLHSRDASILKRVYILVDARVGLQSLDVPVMGWFDELEMPYTVVLTKIDRVKINELMLLVNDLCMRYHAQLYGETKGFMGPIIHVTSSKTNKGMHELLNSIESELFK